jgi:hypothetical protein
MEPRLREMLMRFDFTTPPNGTPPLPLPKPKVEPKRE